MEHGNILTDHFTQLNLLPIIFFLLNRQQRSAVIYPPTPTAHQELPSLAQFLSQSKGIPKKTSWHRVMHVILYHAAMKSRCQSTPWPCLCPSDHYLTCKQNSDVKDGG